MRFHAVQTYVLDRPRPHVLAVSSDAASDTAARIRATAPDGVTRVTVLGRDRHGDHWTILARWTRPRSGLDRRWRRG